MQVTELDYGRCKDETQFAGKLLSQDNSLKNHLLSTILGKTEDCISNKVNLIYGIRLLR